MINNELSLARATDSVTKELRLIADNILYGNRQSKQQLLDDFAKAAMQGMVSKHGGYEDCSITAHKAYDIASAMIQERERRNNNER